MNQVGEERDASCANVDRGLHQRGCEEKRKRDRDGSDAGARANDRGVDEPMRVAVAGMVRLPFLAEMVLVGMWMTMSMGMVVAGAASVVMRGQGVDSPRASGVEDPSRTCSTWYAASASSTPTCASWSA